MKIKQAVTYWYEKKWKQAGIVDKVFLFFHASIFLAWLIIGFMGLDYWIKTASKETTGQLGFFLLVLIVILENYVRGILAYSKFLNVEDSK